jgi:hypothetical protein
MSEVISIDELRKKATTIIEIPDFEGAGTIKVRVQKPRLMAMAAQGKIPNHLLGVVNQMMFGKKNQNNEPKLEEVTKIYELYCRACLVEPTYEEFKEFITDDQMQAIFDWAMGDAKKLETFRTNEGNGSSDNNGQ